MRYSAARIFIATACAASAHAYTAVQPAEQPLLQTLLVQRDHASGKIEFLGSGIVWLLLTMSAVSVAVFLTATVTRMRSCRKAKTLEKDLTKRMGHNDLYGAQRAADAAACYLGHVVAPVLHRAEQGTRAAADALDQADDEHTGARMRSIEPLHLIGAIAPMLGLFGTVYGMILAFRAIVGAGGSPDPVDLAAGIGSALATTFWGLVVAIPAMTAHAILRAAFEHDATNAARVADNLTQAVFQHRTAQPNTTTDDASKPAGNAT